MNSNGSLKDFGNEFSFRGLVTGCSLLSRARETLKILVTLSFPQSVSLEIVSFSRDENFSLNSPSVFVFVLTFQRICLSVFADFFFRLLSKLTILFLYSYIFSVLLFRFLVFQQIMYQNIMYRKHQSKYRTFRDLPTQMIQTLEKNWTFELVVERKK